MKTFLLVLVAAGVSGCAVYPAPYDAYGTGPPQTQVVLPPVYIYGGGASPYGGDGRAHPNPRPRARDQDRDGIPNRLDRDRDGDGVPNRWDSRPNDPRSR
jgi:hypothetical protein